MKSSKETKSKTKVSAAKKKTSAVRKKATKAASVIKSAVKKTVRRRKPAAKKTVAKKPALNDFKQVPKLEEEVTKSKFLVQQEEVKEVFMEEPSQLPDFYGEDKVVLLVRDPYWLYAYWEITEQAISDIQAKAGDGNIGRNNVVLRVKDITGANPNNPASSFDINVADGSSSWYINVSADNRNYCVEIGLMSEDGRFFMVSRSNSVTAPRAGVSDVYDEKWMTLEDYDRVYGLSGGLNIKGMSSVDIRKQMTEKFESALSSGALSSGVLSSGELGGGKSQKDRDFFLVVDAELIVYGRTVPSAKLTIQGKPKSLNPDGTFSARFSLPMASRQEIPVTAVSSDGVDKLTITPVVSREENK